MVLDALLYIKNKIDPTLTLRRSCREDLRVLRDEHRRHQYARLYQGMDDVKGAVKVYPLPHMPVVKDLVPDLTNFYAQHRSIEPWLKTYRRRLPRSGSRAIRPAEARWALRVHSLPCCSTSCPATGGMATAISAPRFCCRLSLADRQPRRGQGRALDNLEDPFRLYRCNNHHELRRPAPRAEPGQGDRRNQEDDGRAARFERKRRGIRAESQSCHRSEQRGFSRLL